MTPVEILNSKGISDLRWLMDTYVYPTGTVVYIATLRCTEDQFMGIGKFSYLTDSFTVFLFCLTPNP